MPSTRTINVPIITEVYASKAPDTANVWNIHECGSDTLLEQVFADSEDEALTAARDEITTRFLEEAGLPGGVQL